MINYCLNKISKIPFPIKSSRKDRKRINSIFHPGLFLVIILFFAYSCQSSPIPSPKPRAFPKVIYPEGNSQTFDKGYCNFSFQYPIYTEVQQDTSYFDEKPSDPCWFNIYYPSFDSRIYFTYYPVGIEKSFDVLLTDAFEMVEWHNKKANYIDEYIINRPEAKVHGVAFNIEGPAASPFQFYLTDSTNHFLRGSVYFNTKARPDSLAPIFDFVKGDALRMIESLEWQE